ncbi:hypothetical protein CAOG_07048 [Capsaspora owczarzaki ATCC 30864]|nr:hypothetical protein CAOG_07048 [Capsaspora owczarzaki ATCC 30864]|eukprot:XP_004343772.2 hypothetical protein CAOG_07048 [Capsaspora owczarzaki ATCC 30864]
MSALDELVQQTDPPPPLPLAPDDERPSLTSSPSSEPSTPPQAQPPPQRPPRPNAPSLQQAAATTTTAAPPHRPTSNIFIPLNTSNGATAAGAERRREEADQDQDQDDQDEDDDVVEALSPLRPQQLQYQQYQQLGGGAAAMLARPPSAASIVGPLAGYGSVSSVCPPLPDQSALRVAVQGAEMRSSAADNKKLFATYRIEVSSSVMGRRWTVFRRYNQFYSLNESLRRSIKTALPLFPGKKALGNKRPEFIEMRRRKLEQYMQELLSIPNLPSLVAPFREILEFLEVFPPTASYLTSSEATTVSSPSREHSGTISAGSMNPLYSPSVHSTSSNASSPSSTRASSRATSPAPSLRSSRLPWRRRRASQQTIESNTEPVVSVGRVRDSVMDISDLPDDEESDDDDSIKPLFVTINVYGDLRDFEYRMDEDENDGDSLKDLDNAASVMAVGGTVKPRASSRTRVGSFLLVDLNDLVGTHEPVTRRGGSTISSGTVEDNVLAGVQACLLNAIFDNSPLASAESSSLSNLSELSADPFDSKVSSPDDVTAVVPLTPPSSLASLPPTSPTGRLSYVPEEEDFGEQETGESPN